MPLDRPASAALDRRLKRRGLLDDTLVVWGVEFGRTSYSQGKLTATNYGPRPSPALLPRVDAGGGVKPVLVYGATDDSATTSSIDRSRHYFHATLLHLSPSITSGDLLYQGRRFRLTDVHGAVVKDLIA